MDNYVSKMCENCDNVGRDGNQCAICIQDDGEVLSWVPSKMITAEACKGCTSGLCDSCAYPGLPKEQIATPGPRDDDFVVSSEAGDDMEKLMGELESSPGNIVVVPNQELKADAGKLRYDLVPQEMIGGLAQVLTFGAAKYKEDSWKQVDPARYESARDRHYAKMNGIYPFTKEYLDDESGLPHWAHYLCNCLFLAWFNKQKQDKTK